MIDRLNQTKAFNIRTALGIHKLKRSLKRVALIIMSGLVVGFVISAVNGDVLTQQVPSKWRAERPLSRVVDLAEAIQMINSGYIVLDVRPAKFYRHSHIPGAISVPGGSIQQLNAIGIDKLRSARGVLIYCEDGHCALPITTARLLSDQGIVTSAVYLAGFSEWTACRLPVEKGTK